MDEPGFDVVVKVVRVGSRQPPLYFRRIVPQRSTSEYRWLKINGDDTAHARTYGVTHLAWHAVEKLGECWLYREEKAMAEAIVNNDDGLERGDVVDVRGTVVNGDGAYPVAPDRVLVRLFSSLGGPVERWFLNDQVTLVTKAVDLDEPPVGALVEVKTPTGATAFYRREDIEALPHWRRQGDYAYSAITWRSVKGTSNTWTRLFREGEI